MKAARFEEMGGDLKFVDLPIPVAGKGQVLIQVAACGLCHTDTFAKYGPPSSLLLSSLPLSKNCLLLLRIYLNLYDLGASSGGDAEKVAPFVLSLLCPLPFPFPLHLPFLFIVPFNLREILHISII